MADTESDRRADTVRPIQTWDHPQTHDCWPHDWELQDRTPSYYKGDPDFYWCVICAKCGGIRCDAAEEPFRCEQVRHHRAPHLFGNGNRREVGA